MRKRKTTSKPAKRQARKATNRAQPSIPATRPATRKSQAPALNSAPAASAPESTLGGRFVRTTVQVGMAAVMITCNGPEKPRKVRRDGGALSVPADPSGPGLFGQAQAADYRPMSMIAIELPDPGFGIAFTGVDRRTGKALTNFAFKRHLAPGDGGMVTTVVVTFDLPRLATTPDEDDEQSFSLIRIEAAGQNYFARVQPLNMMHTFRGQDFGPNDVRLFDAYRTRTIPVQAGSVTLQMGSQWLGPEQGFRLAAQGLLTNLTTTPSDTLLELDDDGARHQLIVRKQNQFAPIPWGEELALDAAERLDMLIVRDPSMAPAESVELVLR